jgi:DNA-binding MarR family transcriptional regulator
VERRSDPKDRRAWRLYVTAQASEVIDGMERIACQLRRECTVGIAYEDMAHAIHVLTRLKENLQALDAVAAPVAPYEADAALVSPCSGQN